MSCRSSARAKSRVRRRVRRRVRQLAAGLLAVAAIAALAAIPSSASRPHKCKLVSPPRVVGKTLVGATLHARHGKWECPP